MADPECDDRTVHVTWCLTERLDDHAIRAVVARLSPEERFRHDRFRFARDRRDFAVAHVLLRDWLSIHGDRAPDSWTFRTGTNGKPVLAPADGARTRLAFNLSHTAGLVACAVGRDVEIGVDVERLDHRCQVTALSERFFASKETAALRHLDEHERQARFIETWVLKEAFTKAIGEGLSCPLDAFTFTFGNTSSLRFDCLRPTRECSWSFALFVPSPDHRMAVAIGSHGPAPTALLVDPELSPVRAVVVSSSST